MQRLYPHSTMLRRHLWLLRNEELLRLQTVCGVFRFRRYHSLLVHFPFSFFFVASLRFSGGGAASRGAPPEPCPGASCLAPSPGARAMQPRPKAVAPRGSSRLRPAPRPLPLPAVGRYIGAHGLPHCPWVPCSALRACAPEVTALASLALPCEKRNTRSVSGGTVVPQCDFLWRSSEKPLNKGSPAFFPSGARPLTDAGACAYPCPRECGVKNPSKGQTKFHPIF